MSELYGKIKRSHGSKLKAVLVDRRVLRKGGDVTIHMAHGHGHNLTVEVKEL